MTTRREFLKEASLLAGGTGLWSSLPVSIQRALAINPDPGTTFKDAEHIVFLMQENRSFDHCFGTLQGVRGFNDPRAITIPGGVPVWMQMNGKGERFAPFRLNMKDTRATWMGGLPHSWTDQTDARNGGKYDKWLTAKKAGGDYGEMPLTLGYYTREDIPFYYALADAFTVCDQNFSSSLTGTTANRSYFWTGTIRENAGAQARVRNSDTYYNRQAHWKTYPERLEENGISWRIYQNELSLQTGLAEEDQKWLANFTDNNLEWFANYHVRFHKAHYDFLTKRISELPGEINGLKMQLKDKKQNESAKIHKILLQKRQQLEKFRSEAKKWSPEKFGKLSGFQKNIHQKAFTTNVDDPHYYQTDPFIYDDNGIEREFRVPKGDVLYRFRQDTETGRLPMVSWLVAPQYFSDHPSAPWLGAWYVSEVLNILTNNPEVWKKTIFILNYDENDGYFDHVPPFTAPKPGDLQAGSVSAGIDTTADYVTMEEEMRRPEMERKNARESSIGLGYRVPLIVASPWSRGGWVNSQVFDITSTIRFLEVFLKEKTGKDIMETNITNWRRTIVGDLTSVFRRYTGEQIKLPEFVDRDTLVKEIYSARFKELPSDYHVLDDAAIDDISEKQFSRYLPGQEQGVRNACPLPYQIDVNGHLTSDKKYFQINFSVKNEYFGKNAAGVPFNVYAPGRFLSQSQWEEVKTWVFAVRAGDLVTYRWPLERFENGQYHLRVYGPNGFFREFKGGENDPEIAISIAYDQLPSGSPTGDIVLLVENRGKPGGILRVEDNAYGTPEKIIRLQRDGSLKRQTIDLSDSFGWYDISVKEAGYQGFEKRYAGRVETGRPSKTDPYMGRARVG